MAEPSEPQSTRKQDDGKTEVSDPTKGRTEHDAPVRGSVGERNGIPEEMIKAKEDSEAVSKAKPTSDRENMETAVTKQKPQGS